MLSSLLSAGFMLGCGSSGPPLIEAKGTVTKSGKPLGSVNVVLSSDTGMNAAGISDESGNFTLSTAGQPGAVAGSYKVFVKPEAGIPPMPGTAEYEQYMKSLPKIAEKFQNPSSSGLTAEVTPEGPNSFSFDVTE